MARGVQTGTGNISPDVDMSLTIADDPSYNSAVVTDTGQTLIRDILGNQASNYPTQYAYGTDSTDPTTSDTSLVSQATKVSIDTTLVQTAETTPDWEDITNIDDTQPFTIDSSGNLKLEQTCFNQDWFEDKSNESKSAVGTVNGDEFNSGDAAFFGVDDQFLELEVSFGYRVPAQNVAIEFRDKNRSVCDISYYWDGRQFARNTSGSTVLSWHDDEFYGAGNEGYQNVINEDLEAGSTHTIRIETNGSNDYVADLLAVYDDRFNYNFPNPDAATNSGGYLSGPELYPDVATLALNNETTRRELSSASVTETWNDTSNNQFIELSNDGGSNFIRTNNSQTASATFASPSNQIQAQLGFSRYGSRTGDEPTSGHLGQVVSTHDMSADVAAITPAGIGEADIRAIVTPNTINGTTIREAAELNTNDTALTRSVFADRVIEADQRLISSERYTWKNP
jgi:hypothetical protein